MKPNLDYGIICNVANTDRVLCKGAKAWITDGTGVRFRFWTTTRAGRCIETRARAVRFENFRPARVPSQHDDRVYFRGSRSQMEAVAAELNTFVERERKQRPC